MKKEKKEKKEIIKIPEGVEVLIDDVIKISGKKGEIKKKKNDKSINIEKEKGQIIIYSKKNTKKEGKKIGSFKAHIKNMIKGVTEGHFYKLKICASHFPMNLSIEKDKFVVKNFLGEKVPRVLKLDKECSIKIDGNEILIEGINKEDVAQTAASIEQLCKIKDRDRRVFQDGIFIINKDGKEIK